METVGNSFAADDARQTATEGDLNPTGVQQDNTPDDMAADSKGQETSQPDGFYRSQQEVDAAFAKRIAAERQKWEEGRATAGDDIPDAEGGPADEAVQPGAWQPGLSYAEEAEFLRGVQAGEMHIRKQDPGFDIALEMEHNPLFALMIAQGEDVKRVYDFFHPQESESRLRRSVEQEIIQRLRMRNNRPDALRSANAGKVSRDISGMSDNEIMEIDQRIKRGERVVL